MGRQFLKGEADMFFPIFTFLQYFFYMGWLKVLITALTIEVTGLDDLILLDRLD